MKEKLIFSGLLVVAGFFAWVFLRPEPMPKSPQAAAPAKIAIQPIALAPGFFAKFSPPSSPAEETAVAAAPGGAVEEMTSEEEALQERQMMHDFPKHLFIETGKFLTIEWGRVPSEEEVAAYLHELNEQIHSANQALSDRFAELKRYHDAGDFDAMERLQEDIYERHVTLRLPPLETAPDSDPSREEVNRLLEDQIHEHFSK